MKKEMSDEELINKFFDRLLEDGFLEELKKKVQQNEDLLKRLTTRVNSEQSATNFANVNGNGNCNYNGASNANGVRPDFFTAAISD